MKKLLLIIVLCLFISNCDNNNEISEDTKKEDAKKIIEQLEKIKKDTKVKKKKKCLSNLVSSYKMNKNNSGKTSFYIKVENFNQNYVSGKVYLTVNGQVKWSKYYSVYANEFIEMNTGLLPLVSGIKYELEIGCNVN